MNKAGQVFLTRRFAPFLLAACLALTSLSCLAASRLFVEPTSTPLPTPTETKPAPTPVPTLTPVPTVDYCPGGDCISACLKHVPSVASEENAVGSGLKASRRFENAGNGYFLVIYTVRGDRIVEPFKVKEIPKEMKTYQDDRGTQQKIWDYFAAIIPPTQRKFLEEYIVFTDGDSNILAAVAQSQTDMGKWVLEVDILDAANPQDLTFTLVHEFGHLLTLNADQVVPSQRVFDNPHSDTIYQQEVDACQTYFVGEGCSLPDAYINTFFHRFWTDIYAEWQDVDNLENEDDYYAALDSFYQQYTDQFVSDYAPTTPEEDIAESFSFFILKPKPTGDSIADQKVRFFYEYPELIELRTQMGRSLCDQLNK